MTQKDNKNKPSFDIEKAHQQLKEIIKNSPLILDVTHMTEKSKAHKAMEERGDKQLRANDNVDFSKITDSGFMRGEFIPMLDVPRYPSEGKSSMMLYTLQKLIKEGKIDPTKIIYRTSGEIDFDGEEFRQRVQKTMMQLSTQKALNAGAWVDEDAGIVSVLDSESIGRTLDSRTWTHPESMVSGMPSIGVVLNRGHQKNWDEARKFVDFSYRPRGMNTTRFLDRRTQDAYDSLFEPECWNLTFTMRVFDAVKPYEPTIKTYPVIASSYVQDLRNGYDYFAKKWMPVKNHYYRTNITNVLDFWLLTLGHMAHVKVEFQEHRCHRLSYSSELLGIRDQPMLSMLFH